MERNSELRTKERNRTPKLLNRAQKIALGSIAIGIFSAGALFGSVLTNATSNTNVLQLDKEPQYLALFTLLDRLRKGGDVVIEKNPIALNSGRERSKTQPLVYGVAGRTYFAYFSQTPIDIKLLPNSLVPYYMTARATSNYAIDKSNTEEAHLNNNGLIVSPNNNPVAYTDNLPNSTV